MSHIGDIYAFSSFFFSVQSMQIEKHSTLYRHIGPKDMFIVLLYVVFIVNVLLKSIQLLLYSLFLIIINKLKQINTAENTNA